MKTIKLRHECRNCGRTAIYRDLVRKKDVLKLIDERCRQSEEVEAYIKWLKSKIEG